MNDTHDDAGSMLDDDVPLGEFLDEQLARAKDMEHVETNEIIETDEVLETENVETPIRHKPLSASWERRSPDLSACDPRRGFVSGPVRPIFTSKHSRPSRGAEPCEVPSLARGRASRGG